LVVTVPDRLCEFADRFNRDQIDRTTAKAAAGHARAKDTSYWLGEINHHIKLLATDFVIVAQTVVRFVHELPESFQISIAQSVRRFEHSIILSCHMPAALENHFAELSSKSFDIVRGQIAQRCYVWQMLRQNSHALFTLLAARTFDERLLWDAPRHD